MGMNYFKQWLVGSMGVLCMIGVMLILAAGAKADPDATEGDGRNAAATDEMAQENVGNHAPNSDWALFFGVALTVGVGCVSAGYAVAKVGAAALGAASEKPEIMGRALIFVGLAEGIAIYGLIVGLIMLTRG